MHDDDARVANLLGACALAVGDAERDITEAAAGFGGAAAGALVTVESYPNRSIETLRRALGLTHPGAVRLVDRLVEQGWMRREPGEGRQVAVVLTAAGRRIARRLLAARMEAVGDFLTPLSYGERRQLEQLLEKLLASRSHERADLLRLCRLCERRVCVGCPVAAAVA